MIIYNVVTNPKDVNEKIVFSTFDKSQAQTYIDRHFKNSVVSVAIKKIKLAIETSEYE